tara:strand:- start:128 stop:247 length:120 start_codon:yes stop_codon:yes gene_type:complete
MIDFLTILYSIIMFGLFGLGVFSTIVWVLRTFDNKEFND